jgi:putative nucleotidyltransferase with HDIG domain
MTDPHEIIKAIDDFPPVPKVVNQILAAAGDPNTSMSSIADIIIYDPVMTANMLKVCNSVYFSLTKEVNSIHEATVLLGLDKIIELCIFRCAFENLHKAQDGYNLAEGQLVKHAISSALISKTIAEKLKVNDKYLIFTASLLKDIGKLIMERFVAQSSDIIDHHIKKGRMSLAEAEKAVLGIDHAELGGLVMERWGFSHKMVYVISNHHMLAPHAKQDVETAIVYLADLICMLIGVCAESDGSAYAFYDEAVNLLKISESDIDNFIITFLENRDKIDALLNFS